METTQPSPWYYYRSVELYLAHVDDFPDRFNHFLVKNVVRGLVFIGYIYIITAKGSENIAYSS